ncbi:MAG: phage capsid protein [Cetobacterium sp.]|uniref:phage capsid protein n=1 Tax=Cetobacterium sp. TaxID=2071632 RepID=UPI003EE71E71
MAEERKVGSLVATKQDEFAKAMLMRMQEEKGSKILDFCEKATVSGANTYTFYRFGESEVGTKDIDMYRENYAGNAGKADKYVATIDYIYASDKIKAAEVNSTSLDLKSSFVNSLIYAMKRNVDYMVLHPIDLSTADKDFGKTAVSLLLMGDGDAALDSEGNVNALIEAAVFASTLAKETSVEGRPSVAIVVTAREFAILHRAEKITNTNYATVNPFQRNTLFGCEVVKVAESVKNGWANANAGGAGTDAATVSYTAAVKPVIGQIILIPQGTVGAASWENDVEAKSWWDDAQDSLFCRTKRSLGTVMLEPNSIIRLVYKI